MSMSMILVHTKTRAEKMKERREKMMHKGAKAKFIRFIQSTPLYRDVDEKTLARRRKEVLEHKRFLMKNKITKKEIKQWFKDIPMKHKREAISLATGMVGSGLIAPGMLIAVGYHEVTPAIIPIAQAVAPYAPYAGPLVAFGLGSALVYDLWHMPHSQVSAKLKKLGKWTDHEIEWIVSHLKRHKKKNPKMFHGVSKHHVKKLHKVM